MKYKFKPGDLLAGVAGWDGAVILILGYRNGEEPTTVDCYRVLWLKDDYDKGFINYQTVGYVERHYEKLNEI